MKAKLILYLSINLAFRLSAEVLPNDTLLDGKPIGDWSAEWWKWMVVIPTNQNPQLDLDGSFAAVGQPEGDVFFVGYVPGFTPGTVTRSFRVPEGKYLFLPLMTYEADNVDSCPPCFTIEELRGQAAAIVDDPVELHASIDGVEVPDLLQHRAISPVFSFFYDSPDNFESFAFGHSVTGLIDPAVCDGYWLMIEPLPAGVHTLHFGGTFRNGTFTPNDIIDHITVVPKSLSAQVGTLIDRLTSSLLLGEHRQAFLATLSAAKTSFDSENLRTGINQLSAFQNKVRAQLARSNQLLADELIQAAQHIIDQAAQQITNRATRELP